MIGVKVVLYDLSESTKVKERIFLAKQNKYVNRAAQDVAGNRLLSLLVAAFFGVMALMFIYDRGFNTPYPHNITITYNALKIFIAVFSLAAVFTLARFITNKYKKKDESSKVFTSFNIFMGMLICLISVTAVYFFDIRAIKALYVLIPSYVALFIINEAYTKDFLFLSGFFIASGIFFYTGNKLLYDVKVPLWGAACIFAFCLICAALIFASAWLKKNSGAIKSKKSKEKHIIVKYDFSYIFLIAAPAISILFALFRFMNVYAMRWGLFFEAGFLMVAFIFYTFRAVRN